MGYRLTGDWRGAARGGRAAGRGGALAETPADPGPGSEAPADGEIESEVPSRAADLPGWAFAAATVIPAVICIAWLVPGLALLLAGRFLPVPVLLIAVPTALVLTVAAVARPVRRRWRGTDLGRWAGRGRARPWTIWWGLAGTVAVGAAFAAWQVLYTSPEWIVNRAAGAAAQTGFWIAEYGSLPITRSLGAFGGSHAGLTFSTFGFAGHGGAVVPQVAPGLPIALSAGLWAHGLAGAAIVTPILGAFAIIAAGGLTGRLAGPQWAPAGAALLALALPEIYTSRSGLSQPLAQALLFGGLCLVVDALGAKRSGFLAALAGVALGLVVVTGPGMLMVLAPVIPFAATMAAWRRPQALALGGGVAGAVAFAVAGDLVLSGPAVAAALRPGGLAVAGFAAATAVGLAIAAVPPARRTAVRWMAARPLRWLPDAAAVVFAAAMIGFAVRPYVQTVRGPANSYVGYLQQVAYLVTDPGRRYAEDSFYWLVWYVGAPMLVLGVAGLAVAARRCLRSAFDRRDPAGVARAAALPAGIIGWAVIAVLWQPGTVPDQPWASRRLVPAVLPGLVVFGVWMMSWLIARARARGAGLPALSVTVTCFVVALAAPAAATTFGLGARWNGAAGYGPKTGGLAVQRVGAGEAGAIRRLCGQIPSGSSVVIVDRVAARRFAQVIRGMCDVPVGVMVGAGQAQVHAVVTAIERAGRRPVLLASRSAGLGSQGARPERVVALATRQDAHVLTQPPASTWPVRYQLWMTVAGEPALGAPA